MIFILTEIQYNPTTIAVLESNGSLIIMRVNKSRRLFYIERAGIKIVRQEISQCHKGGHAYTLEFKDD